MKILHSLCIGIAAFASPLLVDADCDQPLINEFEPNPFGTDPSIVSVEILCADIDGGVGTTFSGFLLSIESDSGTSAGFVDRVAEISGTFDSNGLLVVEIPDLENPSFTLVLLESFSGDTSTDIDLDNDGVPDDLSTFGTIFDAIGISDTTGEPVYGAALGGTDFAYTGDEPQLFFRDGTNPLGAMYALNDPTNDEVQVSDGTSLSPASFDQDPLVPTFGAVNPSLQDSETTTPSATPSVTLIHEIQGSSDVSPLVGMIVTVEAVVVGDFQSNDDDDSRNLGGFFLQEEDGDTDGSALTSEGIFVFDGANPSVDVNLGDLVRVSGTVAEFFGETQIASLTEVTILVHDFGLPMPTVVNLPADATTINANDKLQPDLEAYEGMLVTFSDTLVINEMFQLDRFNEIKLVQGNRPFQFTQQSVPSIPGYQAHLEDIGRRQITYDDGLQEQNAFICNLDGFGPCPFTTATDIRMGDTVTGLTGVLYYKWAGDEASGSTWRVTSVNTGDVSFDKANLRPDESPNVGDGQYKLASVNVLNFFATIDLSGVTTANGSDPRGADTSEEFSRQLQKLVLALLEMDADILGLVELENDFLPGAGGNAIEKLVNEMNAEAGEGTYSWVDPGAQFVDVGDAISNGLIYKTASIQELTGVAILRDEDLAALGLPVPSTGIFNGISTNRASIAAGFIINGACVLISVNHFKSKGSVNMGEGNEDIGDGAANNNAIRLLAAEAVKVWLDSDPLGTPCERKAIIGDLNSYAKEEPITFLENEGYTDVERAFNGESAYSFVFDGQRGTLDYVMANSALFGEVTGAETWKINADEPDALDYNLDFGKDPNIFDETSPLRFSDHDALVVGFDIVPPSCGVADFHAECVLTSFCKKIYATAYDCKNSEGGVCFCGDGEVCGCVEEKRPNPPNCGVQNFKGECRKTSSCKTKYPAAFDCKNSEGGVCFCGDDEVCGCVSE